MLKKNKFILSTFLLVFSSSVFCNCEKYPVRWVQNKKTIEKTENICLMGRHANSIDCSPLVQKSCPFSALKKSKEFNDMIKPLGSPGFNLCHTLEGSPQLYEIKINNEWKRFERCFWKKTQSFVDIDELVSFYKTL